MIEPKSRSFWGPAAMLVVGILCQPLPAWCTLPAISLHATSSPTVVEFNDGEIKFVITNISNADITIDSIKLGTPSIDFVKGDFFDAVVATAVDVVPFPCPFVLHPLNEAGFVHSCSFEQTFDTFDSFPGLSDDDDGQWYIYNNVGFTLNGVGRQATGRGLVTVTDPTPEPSSLALISLGAAIATLLHIQKIIR